MLGKKTFRRLHFFKFILNSWVERTEVNYLWVLLDDTHAYTT